MLSSIKAKIITFYMAVLFVILSVLGVFLYFSLGKIVYDAVDSSLLSRAKALTTLVSSNNNKTEFEFSDDIMWEYNSPKSKSFFQIRRLDGFTLEKSESLKDSELPLFGKENQTDFKTILLNGSPTRLVNFYPPDEVENTAKDRRHSLVIQCAEDIQNQINLLKRYRLVLFLSILFIMLISASGGFIISRKALAPVRGISETIDKISESNLSERINVEDIPEELRILASSFNRTFKRLEMAFNRQRQFTADASHELRTPLSVIMSQSEITLRKERSLEEYKNTLTAVTEAAGVMSATIQKLLTLTRLSTDKISLKFETIDLNEIIRESVKLLRPLAEQKGISIDISPPVEPFVVHGDRTALLELFTNLLDNSIKYNVPQGKIYISARKETGFIVCEIKDTGIGIPEGDLDKVFDRFYQVDKSRSKEISGSGLGLSICHEIVKLHGGKIDIESRIGSGTTITVSLKEGKGAAHI
jgi:heavy metal sensor kinase